MPRFVSASLLCGVLLLSGLASRAADQSDDGTRYGVAVDAKTYLQATAGEALASVVKAVENKRFEYLVAQLADPGYIDDRVRRLYGGKFEEQVEETRVKMDAGALKLLQRFLKDGEWTKTKDGECVRLKNVNDRCVCFRKIAGRWYMQNRYKPAE